MYMYTRGENTRPFFFEQGIFLPFIYEWTVITRNSFSQGSGHATKQSIRPTPIPLGFVSAFFSAGVFSTLSLQL